jgi:hypothetical protein
VPTYIFTPPNIPDVPPTSYWERAGRRDGTVTNEWATKVANPLGSRLFSFYKPRPAGVAVYEMDDGTYRTDRPVPQGPTLETAWPPVPVQPGPDGIGQVNGSINQSWLYSRMISNYVQTPGVVKVYYGGTSYQVTQAEYNNLVSAGFGSNVEVLP